jgi:hypothetical protein
VKLHFTKTSYPVFAKQKYPFLVKLLSSERRFGLIQKQVYFGEVTLHQKLLQGFCAAKIFLWSSFLFKRKVVRKRFNPKQVYFGEVLVK